MKLYYTKGTCSFGPHIAMRELGIEPELIAVNLMEMKLPDGGDFKGGIGGWWFAFKNV